MWGPLPHQVVSTAKGSTAYRAAPGLKCWGSWLPTQVPGRGTPLPHPLWVSPYHLLLESVWVSCVLTTPPCPPVSAPLPLQGVCMLAGDVSMQRGEDASISILLLATGLSPLLRVLCPTYPSSP